MKKLSYLIVLVLILGLALAGCTFLSNIGQLPTTGQNGITYLTKNGSLPNLVGLWHFDEGSGVTAYDSSGNGNNGTIIGATYAGSANSMFGNALSFDGDGDYVQLPASNAILDTNTFTIEAWFKTSINHPVYGGTEGRIVNLARDAAGFSAVALYVEENNIAVCYRTTTKFKHLKHAVNYHDDVWHHIAVTRDASTYKLYYDGSLVASQADTFYGFGTSAAYFGTFNSSGRFFNGLIDEVRIWNTALTPSMIEERICGFNGLMAPYAPPDQKFFKLGSTIPLKWQYTDSAGNVVDSDNAYPVVQCQFVNNGNGGGELEDTEYPGLSGLRYKIDTKTWQFNWQTKSLNEGEGTYKIWITNIQTGQVNGPFFIELR